MKFKDSKSLEDYFENNIIPKLVSDVLKEMQTIIKGYINEKTYHIPFNTKGKPTGINEVYLNNGTPTYEFRDNAWVFSQLQKVVSGYVRSLFYDYSKLSPPDSTNVFRHGSFGIWGDYRQDLPYILNIYFQSGNMLGLFPGKGREPFWDLAIDYINSNFEDIVKKKLQSYGFIVRRK